MVLRKSLNVFTLLIAVLILLVFSVPAAAQTDLTRTYTFDSGTTLHYPLGWTFVEGNGSVAFTSAATRVYVLDDTALRVIGVPPADDEADALQMYYETYHNPPAFDAAHLEPLELSGRSAVQYVYDDGEALIIAFRNDEGVLGLIEAFSREGTLKETDLVLALAESVVSTAAACTVSTSADGTVRVRVGPGENRAPIVFLPAAQDFEVLGKASADDGSLWWKLDKAAVAPHKAANEVWVAQVDVEAAGNCEAVRDVNAPPIIPLNVMPPPAAAAAGNTGGTGSGQTGAPAPAGSGLPLSGTYIASMGDGSASCADIPSFNFMPDFREVSMSVVAVSASVFYLDGSPITRSNGNTFSGVVNYVDFDNLPFSRRFTLTVVSSTQMVGSFSDTLEIDGRLCSATVPITMNKQ